MPEASGPVSELLRAVSSGEREAVNRLFEEVHAQLRTLARERLRAEAPGHDLQTTLLVQEFYLRVFADSAPDFESRRHFFGTAARAMRQILVDAARRRGAAKRGGDRVREELQENRLLLAEGLDVDPIALDEALDALADVDPRKVDVVLLRYYLDLSESDAADILGVSRRTVSSDWAFAQAFLRRHMCDSDE